jgi:hypothetical protein
MTHLRVCVRANVQADMLADALLDSLEAKGVQEHELMHLPHKMNHNPTPIRPPAVRCRSGTPASSPTCKE